MLRSLLTRATAPAVCAGLLWTAAPRPRRRPRRCPGPRHYARPPASPAPTRPVASSVWADRATSTYRALQGHLYQGTDAHRLYLEHTPDKPPTRSTPICGRSARPRRQPSTCRNCRKPEPPTAVTRLSGSTPSSSTTAPDRARATRPYLPAPLGTGGDIYYDDNAVVALSQLDQYEATGDRRLLERAEQVVPVVSRAWDDDATRALPGRHGLVRLAQQQHPGHQRHRPLRPARRPAVRAHPRPHLPRQGRAVVRLGVFVHAQGARPVRQRPRRRRHHQRDAVDLQLGRHDRHRRRALPRHGGHRVPGQGGRGRPRLPGVLE